MPKATKPNQAESRARIDKNLHHAYQQAAYDRDVSYAMLVEKAMRAYLSKLRK